MSQYIRPILCEILCHGAFLANSLLHVALCNNPTIRVTSYATTFAILHSCLYNNMTTRVLSYNYAKHFGRKNIVGPYRLQAEHKMQHIATDDARSVVCVCVCLSVRWTHGNRPLFIAPPCILAWRHRSSTSGPRTAATSYPVTSLSVRACLRVNRRI